MAQILNLSFPHAQMATFEPGYLNEFLSGRVEGVEINPGITLIGAFFWLVPMLMMYLSLILNPKWTRRLSITLGIILDLMNLYDLFGHVTTLTKAGA
jgi:hypothetical protein